MKFDSTLIPDVGSPLNQHVVNVQCFLKEGSLSSQVDALFGSSRASLGRPNLHTARPYSQAAGEEHVLYCQPVDVL